MHKRLVTIAIVCLVAVVQTIYLLPLPAGADLEEYVFPDPPSGPIVDVGAAPIIVIGTAGEGESFWSATGQNIHTLTSFHVEKVKRGEVASDIKIRTLGGTVGLLTQIIEPQPVFEAGERSRLFLHRLDNGNYKVFGGDQGKQDEKPRSVTKAGSSPPFYWSGSDAEHDQAPTSTECGGGYCLRGYKWASNHAVYLVNPNTADVEGEENAVIASFNSWENDVLATMDFTYGGPTPRSGMVRDSHNVVSWSSNVTCENPNAFGCRGFWATAGYADEADIEFNDNYNWIIGAAVQRADVESVAVHEAGHFLGLYHSDCNNVMGGGCYQAHYNAGTLRRTLGEGDRNGVRRLYPDGIRAYADFRGGTRIAQGDVDGNGVNEIITGAGPGGGPLVRVFRIDGTEITGFYAYDPSFPGGVDVATGDVDLDGRDEIITGPGPGGGPHVRIFRHDGTEIGGFMAYGSFPGGVNVAAGDVDLDGKAEIITGPGPGGGPHVQAFEVNGTEISGGGFYAYDPSFSGGVDVASGNVHGDVRAEIITGAGPGGGPHVRVFNLGGGEVGGFYAYHPSFSGGVRVASGDSAEIVTGPISGGGPHLRVFRVSGADIAGGGYYAFHPDFSYGIDVSSSPDRIAAATRTDTALFKQFAPAPRPDSGPEPGSPPDPDPGDDLIPPIVRPQCFGVPLCL